MHGDDADDICDKISNAIIYCNIDRLGYEPATLSGPTHSPEEVLEKMVRRQTLRVSYAMDRMTAIALNKSVAVADNMIDVEICMTSILY